MCPCRQSPGTLHGWAATWADMAHMREHCASGHALRVWANIVQAGTPCVCGHFAGMHMSCASRHTYHACLP
eukprot:191614-Chlamydomonas_euryale.AAC.8